MAKHTVTLSDETWQAVEKIAHEAYTDASAVIESIVSDSVADSEYVDDLFREQENDEAAEE